MEIQTHSNIHVWNPQFAHFPVLSTFFRSLSERDLKIDINRCQQGVEIQFLNLVNSMPNRARLRIFFPAESKCMLFFYKKSSIPFSRDRFSYGGVVIDARSTSRFDDKDVGEWIEFLISGLQPKFRPASLKKSLPYTVPED